MSFGDWLRNFFSQKRNPQLEALESFARDRKGVEGYIEPRTATQPTTLLLVDRVGDSARAPVREPQDGAAFCERLGIPVYDAQVIGYPQRMVDFESGRKPDPEALDKTFEDLERRFSEPDKDTPNN
ncbi:MAG: hypothetical protein ACR2LG_12795 [Actinomycetota bacterium]|nr:hypothetical protein [Actinomycetota bacterium]